MRILLLFVMLQLAACAQQSSIQTISPEAQRSKANPSVAVLPGPPNDLPNGQEQYFCTAIVGLC